MSNSGKSLKAVHEVIKDQVDFQFSEVDSLDGKAGILIGFTGIVITVIFTLFPRVWLPVFVAGLFLIFVSLFGAIWTYKTERFRRYAEPRALAEYYVDEPEEKTVKTLIASLVATWEYNRPLIARKARRLNYSFYAASVGLVLVAISVFIK